MKTMTRYLAAAICSIGLTATAAEFEKTDPQSLGFSTERLERLDALVTKKIEAGLFPGAVTMILRDGKVAHLSALGKRTPDGAPMTEDTIFRIYSMTKPIVSVMTMMLVEEGRVLLGDPVHKYLPEFKEMTVATGVAADEKIETTPAKRPMRVHDLLRHSAGLTYGFFGKGPARTALNKVNDSFRTMTNREVSKALAALPLEHEPGTAWEYSRATDVLGALIEVVEGAPLGKVLKGRIFEPLGMTQTAFWVADPADHNRIAEPMPEDRKVGRFDVFDPRKRPTFESGGGGLMSTIHDYARFAQMMMNGGEFNGVRLLSPTTVRSMTADHMGEKIKPGKYFFVGDGYGFGLGFGVRRTVGVSDRIGNAGVYGWGGAAGTAYTADPKSRTVMLYMMQSPKHRGPVRRMVGNVAASAFVGPLSD
ncbi:MAG: serine hydrolase domain-containing protein [Burkholderiaceae bacterium]